jgi:hypothetical protein
MLQGTDVGSAVSQMVKNSIPVSVSQPVVSMRSSPNQIGDPTGRAKGMHGHSKVSIGQKGEWSV